MDRAIRQQGPSPGYLKLYPEETELPGNLLSRRLK